MMVIDASAAMNAAFDMGDWEVVGEQPSLFADGGFIAPRFFNVEIANVAWKYVHTGQCDEKRALGYAQLAARCVDAFFDDGPLIVEAFQEAARLDHAVYDMLYYILARRTGSALLTADKKLARLCNENGVESITISDLL